MRRKFRKHRTALIALAIYNLVLFFPLLFMGRVLSPNDTVYGIDPWAQYRPASVFSIQNALLTDVPTSLLSAVSLLRDAPETFHWNPYTGSGTAGIASGGSPVITPFVLLPALTLPIDWVYTGIVFLKLNLAFLFAYGWLREERMGKRPAAAGAIVASGAGILAVRWFWQLSSAAALYPLLLWFTRRMFGGRRTPVWLMTLGLGAYLLSASPVAMAYGAWLSAVYALFLAVRLRAVTLRGIGAAIVALGLAFLITAPAVVPYAYEVIRSGVTEAREQVSQAQFYPASQWRSFLSPERLGSPAFRNWTGDKELGRLNNFAEATVYLGLLTLPLAVLAIFNRRKKNRLFWIGVATVLLLSLFGLLGTPGTIGRLPGIKYAPLTRLALLLPITAAFLVAAGTALMTRIIGRRSRAAAAFLATTVAVLLAGDLSHFAGRFNPYLVRADASVPSTPTIEFLCRQPGPFRIAPMFNFLWPDASAIYRLEDIRSRFSSDLRYRKLLKRIDPSSGGSPTTVVQFNSLQFDVDDPLVGMLGVRYLVEHRSIDILKWGTFAKTLPGVKQTGGMRLPAGVTALRTVAIDQEPFYAIELPVSVDGTFAAKPRLEVALLKAGAVVWSRHFGEDQIRVMNKLYVPVRPYARRGDIVVLRVRAVGMHVGVTRSDYAPGQVPLFYGRVTSPLVFDRELPDGRVFQYLAELPRFRNSSAARSMSDDEFLATKDIDFSSEAILTGRRDHAVEAYASNAKVTLVSWSPSQQRIATEAAEPMFLSTSEKLTPEMRVTVDGKDVQPVEINMVFAGVRVPAGAHDVELTRGVGRAWWWPSLAALLLLVVLAAVEISAARRRG